MPTVCWLYPKQPRPWKPFHRLLEEKVRKTCRKAVTPRQPWTASATYQGTRGLTQKAPPSFSLIFFSRPLMLRTWFIVRPATKDHGLSWRKCHIKRIHSCLGWGRGQWFWPSTQESWPIRRCPPTGIAICFPEDPRTIPLVISSLQWGSRMESPEVTLDIRNNIWFPHVI